MENHGVTHTHFFYQTVYHIQNPLLLPQPDIDKMQAPNSQHIIESLEQAALICEDPTSLVYQRLFHNNPELEELFLMDRNDEAKGHMLFEVIEAIIEDLGIKKKVFQEVESIVSEDCIIASNTSSLSIASLASSCEKAERFIGIHFFNPVPLMKLVEIIPAVQTSQKTTSEAKSIIDSWGKLTVIAKDTPGFIVNKVARPFYSEALRIAEEGIADFATIDWAMKEIGGFRMGPFELMDFIGNDVNYAVTESVFAAFYFDPRYKPAFTQKRLSEAGWLGRKSGRGYYDYSENRTPSGAEEPDSKLGQQIVNRIVALLIDEAADAVMYGIASVEDVETAMTKGVNYPKGLLAWADEIGIEEVVKQLDDLYRHYHDPRYRCSGLLRSMVEKNEKFF